GIVARRRCGCTAGGSRYFLEISYRAATGQAPVVVAAIAASGFGTWSRHEVAILLRCAGAVSLFAGRIPPEGSAHNPGSIRRMVREGQSDGARTAGAGIRRRAGR